MEILERKVINMNKEFATKAGLVEGGIDEDGAMEYIGTATQWEAYERYCEIAENDIRERPEIHNLKPEAVR